MFLNWAVWCRIMIKMYHYEKMSGKYEITIYTSCVNADKGIYYYTTYENHQIQAVDMHRENLDGDTLRRYPLINEEQIRVVN